MLASNLRASATSPRSIRCLPTSAQTAVCRWLWFRQPHNELLFYARPHLRWSSNDSQVADPDIGLSEKLRSRTSLDLALELRGVEVQASRNNGRNALDVFRALDESDGYRMLLKGIRCLQAYHGLISPLSINHAREIIVKNEAGKVVQDWLFQPHVQGAIESNPQENRVLLPLVAYVLTGARAVTMYHAWTKQHRNITLTMPHKRRAVIKEYLWTDIARISLISAFIAWHPRGLADVGYDYFSTEFEEYEYWLYNANYKNTDGFVVPYFPWENTTNTVSKVYINRLHPASSDSFERGAKQLLNFWRRADPIMYRLDRALIPLKHPNHPSADSFISLLHEICKEKNHHLRYYYRQGSKHAPRREYAQFLYLNGKRSVEILSQQGRREDAYFVQETVHRIWGEDSEFFSYRAIQRHLEVSKRMHRIGKKPA